MACLDGQSLRIYRHAPNTGTRKSWAAADASSRAIRLSMMAINGEAGYPSVLSAKKWGLYDVYFKGKPFVINREYGHYVVDNILFKAAFPAEFHAQTAVEASIQLHPKVKLHTVDDIERVSLETQESAIRIINKRGELYNVADRDHCLQYMVAVGLLYGELTSENFTDAFAKNSSIDTLRNKIEVMENERFTEDYMNPEKRTIANSVQVFYKDGTSTEKVTVDYPLGHKRRREEAMPALQEKFSKALLAIFSQQRAEQLQELFADSKQLMAMSANEFIALLTPEEK
jgi:2-methylcitrate dehydratase